jgi:hypothetical protein
MSKPTIDEQIEAVEYAHVILKPVPGISSDSLDSLVAALATLKWVKHKTKPALDSVMEAFPGATVNTRDED